MSDSGFVFRRFTDGVDLAESRSKSQALERPAQDGIELAETFEGPKHFRFTDGISLSEERVPVAPDADGIVLQDRVDIDITSTRVISESEVLRIEITRADVGGS